MLAKPEYSSPPDEVCCWPRRCGREASRGALAERLARVLWQRGWPGCRCREADHGRHALVNGRTRKQSATNCCYGETNQFCYGTNYIYLWTLQTAQLARLKITANGTTSQRQANRQQCRRQLAAKRKPRCRQNKKPSLAKQEATLPANSKPPAGKG